MLCQLSYVPDIDHAHHPPPGPEPPTEPIRGRVRGLIQRAYQPRPGPEPPTGPIRAYQPRPGPRPKTARAKIRTWDLYLIRVAL